MVIEFIAFSTWVTYAKDFQARRLSYKTEI